MVTLMLPCVLSPGDIILEVCSKSQQKPVKMETILSQLPAPLTLLVIPVSRAANLVHVDKVIARPRLPNPKLYMAKDFHEKVSSFTYVCRLRLS